MQKVFEKIKTWGKENSLVLIYFLFAVLIEMTAVFVVEGTPFLSRPFLSLGLLLLICGILLFIKSTRARTITCTILLILQAVLDLVFSVIFDMTDQYFDFGMLQLRNDAFAILENIPVDFVTFYVGLFFSVMFLVFGLRLAHGKKRNVEPKKSAFFYAGLILAGIATLGISFVTYFPRQAKDKYDEMVDGRAQSAYSAYGMIGNLVGELGNVVFQDRSTLDSKEINDYIYRQTAETTKYFGIAKGKNVVTVLAESLEWYTVLANEEYPNTLKNSAGEKITPDVLGELFPNLSEFYKESVVMTNFHGREKTDIAETLSIVGSYPTGAYINYEYDENTIPYTLPNILKAETGGEITLRSFHNGFKTFYNRQKAHPMLGFEKEGLGCPIDMYDMEKMSKDLEKEGEERTFYNYMDEGERNLDSEMITTAKDLMFPINQRFYTYITTITMHGMYYDRQNLQAENNPKLAARLEKIAAYKPIEENFEDEHEFHNAECLYYYMITGLEFDSMLGEMKKELQSRKNADGSTLWENTVIVVFGDHNAYYESLSNYVKEIPDYDSEKKFTDLYNVPLFIRDAELTAKLEENAESRLIDKFTCTADIVPTLLDLLGIKYFDNLYYGNSVFSDRQSVLYSRAYDVFVGDGLLRRSVKGDFYCYEGRNEQGFLVKDTVSAFEQEGKTLVEKIKYCDYIFRQDHFGNPDNYLRFRNEMKALNNWQ